MAGTIRIGIGGWTFEPWRGVFYPEGLAQKKELSFAAEALSSIEINGTFYSTFKADSWRKWRDETPDDFVFSVKASRYCTNRRELAGMGDSMAKFLGQGLSELGPKLGPINWQFAGTKPFDAADFEAFLKLLPKAEDGVKLRHALEVRNESFACPEFIALARAYGCAIVLAEGDEDGEVGGKTWPRIDEATADFCYLRLIGTREDEPLGFSEAELDGIAADLRARAAHGDVFAYVISGAKVRNPAAAMALIERIGGKG